MSSRDDELLDEFAIGDPSCKIIVNAAEQA